MVGRSFLKHLRRGSWSLVLELSHNLDGGDDEGVGQDEG